MKKFFVFLVILVSLTFSVFADEAPFDKVKVSESLILSDAEIQMIVKECTAEYSGMDLLRSIVDRLNSLYLEKGSPNARAFVPEQEIENRTVVIELVEGRVGTVTVSGEKYTSERFILKSLRIDDSKVLNLTELENKLLSFNRWNQKVALTTTLTPGKDKAGTTDIDIKVNESVPFEGRLSFDNYATESSGSIRFGLNLMMNSLTKNRDPFTVGANMNFKSKAFNADYNYPVFVTSSVLEARLGIRGSYSNSEVENGAFLIKSESVSGSAYMGVLLSRTPKRNICSILSVTYSATTTGIDETKNPTESIINGRLGVSASFIIDNLQISATAGAAIGSQISGRNNIELYGKFDASLSVRFSPAEAFFMSLNASGQWMPFNNIIPNQEMMFAGGASSVRGYSEGVLCGKSGYMVSAEAHLRLPDTKRSTVFDFADHEGKLPSQRRSGYGSPSWRYDPFQGQSWSASIKRRPSWRNV